MPSRFVFLPAALLALAVAPAFAQTPKHDPQAPWPMFGGTPGRNLVNLTDKNVPTSWDVAKGKNIKWVAEVGTRSYGGPVVADGKVFVGTNNDKPRDQTVKGPKAILMCFDEKTGAFLWQAVHDIPANPIFHDALNEGLCSTPVVEGQRLWYTTPTCEVICASTKDGTTLWRLDMMKDLKVIPYHVCACSPLIVGDLVFVVTGNGVDGNNGKVASPKAPSFIAVNKNTGKVAWQSNLPGANIIEGQWSNPVYTDAGGRPQVIFPGGDGWLYSFEPKAGQLLWKFHCNPTKEEGKKGRKMMKNYFVATPVIHGDRLYVGLGLYPERGGTRWSHFWCIDVTKSGDVSPVNDNFDPKAPENKNSALVWHYGGPINPPPKKGRPVVFGATMSTAAVHDGLVYVPEEGGYLHCLDAKTGQKVWEHDFRAYIYGSPLWVDGKVYLCIDDASVYVFKHGRKEEKLAVMDMGETLMSTPVVANGVLYIATKTRVYAIAEK
jgi:outer membrane protein assembly factor BamB